LQLLLALVSMAVHAQNYHVNVQHFSTENGLPDNYIHCIFQDSHGFIWTGTNHFLVRYDGTEMKVFPTWEKSYQQNGVIDMWEDVQGWLWVANYNMPHWRPFPENVVALLHPQTRKAVSFEEYFKNNAPFSMSEIVLIKQDERQHLWILTRAGMWYEYDGQFHERWTIPALMQNRKIDIFANKEQIWIVDEERIWKAVDTLRLELIATHDLQRPSFLGLHDGTLVLANNDEIFKVNTDSSAPIFEHLFTSNLHCKDWRQYWQFRPDGAIPFWHLTPGNLSALDQEGQALTTCTAENYADVLRNINCLFVDQENQAWIGSKYGICKFNIQKNKFTNYLTHRGIVDPRGITSDTAGNVYVAMRGLYQIHPDGTWDRLSISRQHLVDLWHQDGQLWSGYFGNTVLHYDLQSGAEQWFSWADSPDYMQGAYIIHKSSLTGRVWVGMNPGLCYVDFVKGKLLPFQEYNNFDSLQYETVYDFCETGEGIWLATTDGLYLLQEGKGIINRGFPGYFFYAAYRDDAGVFWLGTKGQGLLRWEPSTKTIEQFSKAEGLDLVIYAVYEDDFGYLWLPSNNGLSRFDKTTHQVRTFLPEDGLPHYEFNFSSHHQRPDGQLFLGTQGGVTSFHPQDFVKEVDAPHSLKVTEIQRIQASGEWENAGALEDGKLALRPEESTVQMKLALLSFVESQSHIYGYRWSKNAAWQYVEGNTITLSDLPFGQNTLYLYARSNHGEEATAEVLLLRARPFYREAWFLAGGALLLLSSGVLIWRYFRSLRSEAISAERSAQISPEPSKSSMHKITAEEDWLEKVRAAARELLEKKPDFNIGELAGNLHISERQLQRRLKEEAGISAGKYLREVRLLRAHELLIENSFKTVAEVAQQVGFSSPSYFAKIFEDRFEVLPNEVLRME